MVDFAFGLIGYPLGHSLSPRLHKAALQAHGLEGDYRLYPIPIDDLEGLAGVIDRLRTGELHGLNVTIPYKQAVRPLLDGLTLVAEQVGAVNTLLRNGNMLVGDNTDAPGFLADLDRCVREYGQGKSLDPATALVLGAGGSARAVAHALIGSGWRVIIAARRIEQARQLASSFEGGPRGARLSAVPLSATTLCQSLEGTRDKTPVSLIVNTTPLGMWPKLDSSPWPDELPFPEHTVIYDLVYNPVETMLVRDARSAGLPAFTGLGMLVEQAALSFERWTGLPAPRQEMLRAVSVS